MSSLGSGTLTAGPGKCFAFIDSDNVADSFRKAFEYRKMSEIGKKYYSLEIMLRSVPAYRKYLFSAAPDGKETHDWLVKLRSEQGFLYRQGRLTEKGKKIKQQGVDVMIAVEALKCAHSRIMDSCIIFSDDGDLLPLVSAIVDLGVHTTVISFGNPEKSEVARDFQDRCDMYVHVGNQILAQAVVPEGRASQSGNCNRVMFHSFGDLEEFNDGASAHAMAVDKNGGLYVCNSSLKLMDDYNQYHYYYFADKDAAFARYRLLGSFFQ